MHLPIKQNKQVKELNTMEMSMTFVGKRILDLWFDEACSISELHTAQFHALLTNIKAGYEYNKDLFYGELDTDRETEYSETYYFKLDDNNCVVLCNRYDDYIVRLVWEDDMCSIDTLSLEFAIEVEDHIKLPKYQHFLDYLETTRYYYHNRYEDLDVLFARQNKILNDYVLSIDNNTLELFLDRNVAIDLNNTVSLPNIDNTTNLIWVALDQFNKPLEFLFGTQIEAIDYMRDESIFKIIPTTLNTADVDDYVILESWECDNFDYESVSKEFRDGECRETSDNTEYYHTDIMSDNDLFDNTL